MEEPKETDLPPLALAGNYNGIEACLKELPHSFVSDSKRIHGRFFYLTFRAGRQNIEKLAEFLYWRTIPFCLPRARYKELMTLFAQTNDLRYWHNATDEARDLFVRATNSRNSTGEPAELLLFVLLEHFFKAPQVACKMSLKTAHNVAVFGADAVHMAFDEAESLMLVYWGESKLKEDMSKAFDSTCASVSEFLTPREHTKPQERDIRILKLHANIPDESTRLAYLKFFDPYEEADNQRRDVHACLAAVEKSLFKGLNALNAKDVEPEFCKRFKPASEKAAALFQEKITKAQLHNEHFRLLLIPIEDLQRLREEFFRFLRIDVPPEGTAA